MEFTIEQRYRLSRESISVTIELRERFHCARASSPIERHLSVILTPSIAPCETGIVMNYSSALYRNYFISLMNTSG